MPPTKLELTHFMGLSDYEVGEQPNPMLIDMLTFERLTELLVDAYSQISGGDAQASLWLLAYQFNKVFWGSYKANKLITMESLEVDLLQELRLFGSNGEFYMWRNKDGFAARLRLDTITPQNFKGKEKNGFEPVVLSNRPTIADEWQILWGKKATKTTGSDWTTVSEERGTSFSVPHLLEDSQLPLRLLARHYLKYDSATGLVYYSDLRLVELCDRQFTSLHGVKESEEE